MIEAIRAVVAGEVLDAASMERAMETILSGKATDAQIAALAIALRMRGETWEELVAAARVLRRRCDGVRLGITPLLDTCGTGGDGAGTFNVSTVAAFVVAGAGVAVAKHGNRAVSSRAGSADVLEALGAAIELGSEKVGDCIRDHRFGFLFAPKHHAALRHAANVRRSIGVRTFFNLLGPLASPASASHQLIGVYEQKRTADLAHALGELGSTRAWVVHGEDGLDEITPSGRTFVAELHDGSVTSFEVVPEDFGIARFAIEAIRGGDAIENANIARRVLDGELGPARDVVCINAGAALLIAGKVATAREGAELAGESIDSGAARSVLERYVAASQP